ncbi:MAG: LysR family transcriptional regulator [Myxococcaceae bacterium]|nr:LysR family transcriptional regulator [Myxococcaceae bacterium]
MRNELEFRHLRVVIVLAETLHFRKAAARLGLSQPSVSATLREAERLVGTALFARTRRSVSLTPAGHHLVTHARRAVDATADAVAAARRAGSGEVGALVLGLNAMSAMSHLPTVISAYRARFPAVQVRLVSGGSVALLEAVETGRCDLAFTLLMPTDLSPLASRPLQVDPLVVALPRHHRFARRAWLRFADVIAEPVIHMPREEEPLLHETFARAAADFGRPTTIVAETNRLETLLAFVASGLGVGYLPASVRRLRFEGVSFVDLRPRVAAGVMAVWNPALLPPTGARFLELLGDPAPGWGTTGGADRQPSGAGGAGTEQRGPRSRPRGRAKRLATSSAR